MGRFAAALKRRTHVVGHLSEDRAAEEVPLDGILRTSDEAVLLSVFGEEVWVPLSQLVYADTDEGSAFISLWFAETKGLT